MDPPSPSCSARTFPKGVRHRSLSRKILRWFAGGCILAAILFAAMVWRASSLLISPTRRPLQDYHTKILSQALDHGLRIEPFTVRTSDGFDAPCLLCEPAATSGTAVKGRILREQLQEQGLAIPLFRAIIRASQ